MKALLDEDNYRMSYKDGTGFLTHIDISEEKRQAVIKGDKEVTQEIALEYNMDMDSLLMEAKKERERLDKKDKRVPRAEGGNKETNKSEIEELPLTNYILSLSKPEQSELKKALIGVAGITVGSVESIPMFVKRLVETGSLNKKEVQQVIEDKVQEDEDRKDLSHGGDPLPNEGLEELHKEKPDLVAKMLQKAEGGNVDEQMSMLMNNEQEPPMESDEEMEDNYLDFILDEALNEEEEDMLMSKLEQDEQLAMLFDKVVEVASEFAGSGPVEGPGTGVSDSIPARLSDGEFVFTAKAVEEIGADELMRMMKDAEMRADERQGMANGGEMDEEENVVVRDVDEPVTQNINVTKTTVDSPAKSMEDEDEITKNIRTNMMMRKSPDHVRS